MKDRGFPPRMRTHPIKCGTPEAVSPEWRGPSRTLWVVGVPGITAFLFSQWALGLQLNLPSPELARAPYLTPVDYASILVDDASLLDRQLTPDPTAVIESMNRLNYGGRSLSPSEVYASQAGQSMSEPAHPSMQHPVFGAAIPDLSYENLPQIFPVADGPFWREGALNPESYFGQARVQAPRVRAREFTKVPVNEGVEGSSDEPTVPEVPVVYLNSSGGVK